MAAGLGRSRLSLGFGFALADRLESTGATVQVLRQLVTPLALAVLAVLLGVDLLDLTQHSTHLALKPPLGSEHPLVCHGLVLAGIGFHLSAVECNLAQPHQPSLLTEPQQLNEQPGQGIEVPAAEIADPAVVGLLVAGHHPEGGCRAPLYRSRPSRSCGNWAARRSRRTGAARPSCAVRRPFLRGDTYAGKRHGSPQDPVRRPDRAGRTPGGSAAASPPVMAGAAASARGSRCETTWAWPCPVISPRTIAATEFWADFRASVERVGGVCARQLLEDPYSRLSASGMCLLERTRLCRYRPGRELDPHSGLAPD